ncbi:hypothetical protein ABIA14_004428 [Sinorhizobium fredii]
MADRKALHTATEATALEILKADRLEAWSPLLRATISDDRHQWWGQS